MNDCASRGLAFSLDRHGVEVPEGSPIQLDLAFADVGLDEEHAAQQLGERLTRLLGETVADEEGLFDLCVNRGDTVVAALILSCEDDAIALGGERSSAVTDEELAEALAEALGGAAG